MAYDFMIKIPNISIVWLMGIREKNFFRLFLGGDIGGKSCLLGRKIAFHFKKLFRKDVWSASCFPGGMVSNSIGRLDADRIEEPF